MERGIENAATSRARCSHAMGKNCGRRLDSSARSCSIGTVYWQPYWHPSQGGLCWTWPDGYVKRELSEDDSRGLVQERLQLACCQVALLLFFFAFFASTPGALWRFCVFFQRHKHQLAHDECDKAI